MVRISELEQQVDVASVLLWLEFSNSVDCDAGYMQSHLQVHSQRIFLGYVDVWDHDLLLAGLALLDSLGQELQLVGVQLRFLARLPVHIIEPLLES